MTLHQISLCLALLAVCGCSQIPDIVDVTDVMPVVPVQPTDGAPVSQDAVVLSECTVYEANKAHVLAFAQTVTIKSVSVGRFLTWETVEPLPWKDVNGCNGCLWLLLKRDGKWLASPGDFIRTGQAYKGRGDFKIWNGTEVLRPKPGEQCGFMLSTRCRHSVYPNGMERSNVVYLKWPD